MKWLDELSYIFLIAGAALMLMMPFEPEPHLLEKYHMWLAGELHKPMDLFDIVWHMTPTLLLVLKFVRGWMRKEER